MVSPSMTRQPRTLGTQNQSVRSPGSRGTESPGGSRLCRTSPSPCRWYRRAARPSAARGLVEAELARGVARLEVGRRDPAQPDRGCPCGARSAPSTSSSIAVRASTPPSLVAASSVVRRVIRRKSSYLMISTTARARSSDGAQPHGDAVRLVEQHHRELALVVEVVVERLLVADRDRARARRRPRA